MTNNKGIIHPIGTESEFNSLWYIASYFGEKRSSTWYHSGDDYNLKTGGNTDCGELLVAIADGEVLSTRYSNSGFGNVLTIKFLLNGVTYYALYAHLKEFLVSEGQQVKKGQNICKLGTSGNSQYCHLHFSIKNTANGIDNIPNNTEELKQWENPLKFIRNNYNEQNEESNENTGSSKPESTENMSELFRYLGVSNEEEAKKKLSDHLGEKDGKCDWGNSSENYGGYLGSERRKVKELEKQIADHKCPECPEVNDFEWIANGKTETYTNGDKTITINYAKK